MVSFIHIAVVLEVLMKPVFFCTLAIPLLMAKLSAAGVVVTAPTGDPDPAFLAALQGSIEEVAEEAALPAGAGAELKASAKAVPEGVALEIALIPADRSEEIRETRVASRASALAQARAMARSVVKTFAERARSQAGPAAPEEEVAAAAPSPSPIDLARTAARPGIALGLALDVAGLLGFIVSRAVFAARDYEDDRALEVACVSGGAVVLGSFVLTTSYTVRHAAYRRAGLLPRPYKASLSWVLFAVTTALYGISVDGSVEYTRRDHKPADNLGEALDEAFSEAGILATEILFAMGSILVEAVNLGVVRTLWRRDLRRSERSPAVSVAVTPFVTPGGSRSASPVTGLAAVVQF
jgi:hypothetical protein